MTFGVNGPDALALDKAGNVFVANFLGQSITEYAAGKTKALRVITKSVWNPDALMFDTTGNLYVADFASRDSQNGAVTVYDPHTGRLLATITSDVVRPGGLAFSGDGQLLVSNTGNNSVSIYNRGLKLSREITDGIDHPTELQIDKRGYLYVLNVDANPWGT
jgi:DNA-binding beta-propeller fold protein YncE